MEQIIENKSNSQSSNSNSHGFNHSKKPKPKPTASTSDIPKNSAVYWVNEGKQDSLKGLKPQHPKIKPYMDGFNQMGS